MAFAFPSESVFAFVGIRTHAFQILIGDFLIGCEGGH